MEPPEPEFQSDLNDRRSFIKLLAAAPLFATIGARSFASAVAASAKGTVSNGSSIFDQGGVTIAQKDFVDKL